MSEREQWIELAEMLGILGIKQKTPLAVGMIRVRAMLHGLACMECNGGAWKEEGQWFGHYCCPETGDTLWCNDEGCGTLPKILIAMLTAHREANQ
jgi:hypothetical protein